MTDQDLEVRRALEDARAQPHGYVFAPVGAPPVVVEALQNLAAETGREFLQQTAIKGATDDFVQQYLNRDVPTVHAGDDKGILDNLKAIARGEMRVVR